MRRFLSTLGAGALLAGLIASPASAATTTGTWTQYPNSGAEYQATVLPPLAGANTGHWSANSKGGIPVMFELSSASTPAVFESIGSDSDAANDYAYMSFSPSSLTFNQITTLRTDYQFTLGDCHGGSLRWSISTVAGPTLFIYYGSPPQFGNGGVGGCTGDGPGSVDQSGMNMIGLPDLRYDTSQFPGGTFYDTYTDAVALMGSLPLSSVSLVLDGGWAGDQRAIVANTTVNDSVYQWDPGGTGVYSGTCDLPEATIEVGTTAPVDATEIAEEPVQSSLAADGNAFRVVGCRYQYLLSIPSLGGPGTYYVELRIGGVAVPTPLGPVSFELTSPGKSTSSAGQAQSHANVAVQIARGGPPDGVAVQHDGQPDGHGHTGSGAAARSNGKGPSR